SGLQLNAQEIGNALYGLQNMRDSEPVQAVLKAMVPQLSRSDLRLEAQHIGNALYGLRNMQAGTQIRRLLTAFNELIDRGGLRFYSNRNISTDICLAESLHSLRPHIQTPEAQELARKLFVQARREHLQPSTAIRHSDDVDRVLLRVLRPELLGVDRRIAGRQKLDLHGCSHALGQTAGRLFLNEWHATATAPLTVVFGRASHNQANEGRMRAVVEQLASTEFAHLNWGPWEVGSVTVTPPNVSRNH
ncbi:MAG TPA: hypothetical protein VFS42_09800, partial [Burkholderiaceae bacterium]|nr:hypothetical protein [Burkholderiaceae bacterium]